MTYAKKLHGQIARYAPEDRPALAAFQREMFGEQSRQGDEEHFRWLFERNPHRLPDGPQIWLCRKNGQVLGQQVGIPFSLKVAGQCHRASWAIDLMVRPEWRLRGVGAALSEAYTSTNAITVGLGISDAAYRAFLRGGWIDLGFVSRYVRPLDMTALLGGPSSGRGLARLIGRAADAFVRLADAAVAGYVRCSDLAMKQVDRFDERVDELWASVSRDYKVIARRDFSSLHWRFDLSPERRRYQRLYLCGQGGLRGYAVVRMGEWRGRPAGFVVDYLSRPQDVAALFAGCLVHLRNAGACVLCCITLNRAAEPYLRALGFLRRRYATRLMALPAEAVGDIRTAIAEPANWFVTSADSDEDHPSSGCAR